MNAVGIILAAGRGSRMLHLTEDRPKCLVELAGKSLLHWQLDALHQAGIKRILVVRGYAAERIQGNFETIENPRWAETNMLYTLLCANAFAQNAFASGISKLIVSYSDIVYHSNHIRDLWHCSEHIAITFDTQWESLWKLRCENVLLDAETFRQEKGILQEIGNKPKSLAEIHGQYMGLLSFDHEGWHILKNLAHEQNLEKTDMTSFLRMLLAKKVAIGTVPVAGKWCETDNENDLHQYEEALATETWDHDWRK